MNGRGVRVSVALLLCLLSKALWAVQPETQEVFDRYKDSIVQIRILEASTGARAVLGSGFLVGDDGRIVTNYHVISELIQKPGQYRAEIVHPNGKRGALRVLNFDVVHDLALVRTDVPVSNHLGLNSGPIKKGFRVYALGSPLDLGMTIVEGTYSGLIQESLYEKIHFTGSINAGMSGGPALLADGSVIGVNVATAGNQVSFLVPAAYVSKLIEGTPADTHAAPGLAQVRAQLLRNQDGYMSRLLAAPLPTAVMGHYRVPGKIGPYIKCWGDSNRQHDNLFVTVIQQCATDDDLYLSRTQNTGIVSYKYDLISSDKLNRFRFYMLYEKYFSNPYNPIMAGKEDVSKYLCHTDFVANKGVRLKAVLCLRRYLKMDGLYDVELKAATLDSNTEGLQASVALAGVSFDNALRFTRAYLDAIAWTN